MTRNLLLVVFQVPLTVIVAHGFIIVWSIVDRATLSGDLSPDAFFLTILCTIAAIAAYAWKVILKPHLYYPQQPEEEEYL